MRETHSYRDVTEIGKDKEQDDGHQFESYITAYCVFKDAVPKHMINKAAAYTRHMSLWPVCFRKAEQKLRLFIGIGPIGCNQRQVFLFSHGDAMD